jgi:HNH endonuclease
MTNRLWTDREREVVRELYPDVETSVVAEKLNWSVPSISHQAAKMGIKKDMKLVHQRNVKHLAKNTSGQFKKGLIPWNKGKKVEQKPGNIRTQFKKGDTPVTTKPPGTIRFNKDGHIEIKADYSTTWVMLHRELWKLFNNTEIPDNHAIRFADGNPLNLSPGNLKLTSKAELMRLNNVHNLPEEIKEVVFLKAQITRKINERK